MPVTADLAAGLEMQALAVYSRFDAAPLTPRRILAVALRGSGADRARLLALALV